MIEQFKNLELWQMVVLLLICGAIINSAFGNGENVEDFIGAAFLVWIFA